MSRVLWSICDSVIGVDGTIGMKFHDLLQADTIS